MTVMINELPADEGVYTVVQIVVKGSHVLATSSDLGHRELLEETLNLYNLPWSRTCLLKDGTYGPNFEGIDYRVVGMGGLVIDDGKLKFGGRSLNYPLSFLHNFQQGDIDLWSH